MIVEALSISNSLLTTTRLTLDILKDRKIGVNKTEIEKNLVAMEKETLLLEQEINMLLDSNIKLEKENKQLKQFELDKNQYTKHKLSTGAAVIIKTDDLQRPLAEIFTHCTQCFDDDVISTLQPQSSDFGYDTYHCPKCSTAFQHPNDRKKPQSIYAVQE